MVLLRHQTALHELRLIGGYTLTTKALTASLKSLPQLRRLTLSGCTGAGENFVSKTAGLRVDLL